MCFCLFPSGTEEAPWEVFAGMVMGSSWLYLCWVSPVCAFDALMGRSVLPLAGRAGRCLGDCRRWPLVVGVLFVIVACGRVAGRGAESDENWFMQKIVCSWLDVASTWTVLVSCGCDGTFYAGLWTGRTRGQA